MTVKHCHFPVLTAGRKCPKWGKKDEWTTAATSQHGQAGYHSKQTGHRRREWQTDDTKLVRRREVIQCRSFAVSSTALKGQSSSYSARQTHCIHCETRAQEEQMNGVFKWIDWWFAIVSVWFILIKQYIWIDLAVSLPECEVDHPDECFLMKIPWRNKVCMWLTEEWAFGFDVELLRISPASLMILYCPHNKTGLLIMKFGVFPVLAFCISFHSFLLSSSFSYSFSLKLNCPRVRLQRGKLWTESFKGCVGEQGWTQAIFKCISFSGTHQHSKPQILLPSSRQRSIVGLKSCVEEASFQQRAHCAVLQPG